MVERTIPIVELELTPQAIKVLENRYLRKDDKGNIIETPEQLFWRVASNIAKASKYYNEDYKKHEEEFYTVLCRLEFLPNSPTLMNAGNSLQQLSACFVLPVDDSMESIFETLKITALIHKSGGGTGFSFSRLRPKNDTVSSTHGVSSGPVSFMKVFNAATEAIKQGGRRRGANMGILHITHPDILEFIDCKKEEGVLNNFNISVTVTDDFMRKAERDEMYDLINPRTSQVVSQLRAAEVFERIVENAWSNGEPGIIFIDRVNEANPTPSLGRIESTNPCGEQPLLPYESCNLGSINLSKFVTFKNKSPEINWERLRYVTRVAVRFLDNVIDMNHFPIDKIEQVTKENRKIGLGVMGFADMLYQLGIPYDSKEALNLAEKVMSFIKNEADSMTIELGETRGAFPNFKYSIYSKGKPRRNATVTTIAPTGSIGIIAGCSSGIEPVFALIYTRKNILGGEEMYEVNKYFKKTLEEHNLYSEDLIKEISKTGSIKNIKEIPESIRKVFVTALDISPEDHVRMQAAFQKYVDNAVSKTVNLPNSATKDDVKKVFMLAYKLRCKGVTVYREGSRAAQVLNLQKEAPQKTQAAQTASTTPITLATERRERQPRVRPPITKGMTLKIRTGCGNMYVTINEDDIGPCEVFTQLGKSGGCISSQAEAIGRLISLALRSGVQINEIIEQLKGIRCPIVAISNGESILSCPDGLAKAIEMYLKEKCEPDLFIKIEKKDREKISISDLGICPECPECGNMLEMVEGCAVCRNCGFSKC
jgi:ribonucleoside-diphosphate reductase alpha chain